MTVDYHKRYSAIASAVPNAISLLDQINTVPRPCDAAIALANAASRIPVSKDHEK